MLKRNPNFQCTILVPACICAVIGLILCFVSICTPSWQVVYLRELQQWVENGLWINCQTRPAGMYTCVYTFSESDYNFYTSSEVVNFRTPGKELWQRKLLIAILCAQLSGFLGLFSYCITFYQPASRCSSMFFTSSIGLACVINTVVCIIFSFYSHMVEYRFFHVSVSGIYEKHMGYSFVLQVIGSIFYTLAFILALIHFILKCRDKPVQIENYNRETMGGGSGFRCYNNPNDQFYSQPTQRYGGGSFTDQGSIAGSFDYRMQDFSHVPRSY